MTTKPEQPTLIVEWPACPACHCNRGRATWRTRTTRKVFGDVRRVYAECRSCGERVKIEHSPEWQ